MVVIAMSCSDNPKRPIRRTKLPKEVVQTPPPPKVDTTTHITTDTLPMEWDDNNYLQWYVQGPDYTVEYTKNVDDGSLVIYVQIKDADATDVITLDVASVLNLNKSDKFDSNFDKAFREARRLGRSKFTYQGREYNTSLK